jgi:ABC-type sulfate transport system substrate-binding protein
LKWSHADPLSANSGMMTLGLMLADYTQQTGSDPMIAAGSTKFRTYVNGISRGLVFDLPAQGGSSALNKAFLQNPNRYDFITTYESNAIEAALNDPNIAVIYPNPTAVSENVGAILNGDWLSDTQREGARAFLQFLGSEQSLREGLGYYFRPAQSGGNLSLSPVLNKLRAQGFQQSFSSAELPSYEALNAAAFAWRNSVGKKAAQ